MQEIQIQELFTTTVDNKIGHTVVPIIVAILIIIRQSTIYRNDITIATILQIS